MFKFVSFKVTISEFLCENSKVLEGFLLKVSEVTISFFFFANLWIDEVRKSEFSLKSYSFRKSQFLGFAIKFVKSEIRVSLLPQVPSGKLTAVKFPSSLNWNLNIRFMNLAFYSWGATDHMKRSEPPLQKSQFSDKTQNRKK